MIKDFVFSSDYPIDQVIYRSETASLDVAGYNFGSLNIPHNVGGLFLPIGQFSTTPDFSKDVFDISASGFNNSGYTNFQTTLSVNASSVFVSIVNRVGTPIKFYVRVIGFAVSGDHRRFEPTSYFHDMTFDTDNNQLKLYKADTVDMAANTTVKVPHDLGYKPLTLLWLERAGLITPLTDIVTEISFSVGLAAFVDNENLTFISNDNFPPGHAKYHYRIYADE